VPVFNAFRMSQQVNGARYDFMSFLNHPRALKLFNEHLMNEWAVENLKFWSQVETFRGQYSSFKRTRDINMVAVQTFNTFIKPGALMDVNIPATMREELTKVFEEHAIRDPDFTKFALPATVFDGAQREIYILMEKDSFQRFQNTRGFKGFAAENTVFDQAKQRLVVVPTGGT
jgi:hypothetical protein